MKSCPTPLLTLGGVLLLVQSVAALTPTPTPTPIPTPTYQPVTVPASRVTASTQDGTNVPGNVVDGSLATRWSGFGEGAWVQMDMGVHRHLGHVQIGVYRGNERKNRFDIHTSVDGVKWEAMILTISSGTTTGLETHDVPDHTTRYVRYFGRGSMSNAGESLPWNSVTEMRLFAVPEPSSPPLPPSNVKAEPAAGRVSLTWVSRNATQFRISRRLSQCDTYTVVGTSTTANFTDTTVVDRRHYYYRITAVNAFGESTPSTPVAVTPQLQPPPATVLRATNGPVDSGRIDLSWTALPTATRYIVRRDLKHLCIGIPWTQVPSTILATLDAPATAFTDTTAAPGKTYIYTVTGTNPAGDGARSNIVEIKAAITASTPTPTATPCPIPTFTPTPPPPSVPPTTPTNVTAAVSHQRVRVSWEPGPSTIFNRASSWHVYRGAPSCGPFTLIARDVRAREYVDRDVTNGTTYSYFIVGVNVAGESEDSELVSAEPQPRVPEKPADVRAVGVAPDGSFAVRVYWTHTFSADSYTVKRATESGGPYTTLASGILPTGQIAPTLFYDDTTGVSGTTYYYVVLGVNGAGPGPASDEAVFDEDPVPTPTPTATPLPSLRALPLPASVELTWGTVPAATSYEVRRRSNRCEPGTVAAVVPNPPFLDTGVSWPLRFYYDVTANTPEGPSAFRPAATAPLDGFHNPPTTFRGIAVSGPEVQLSWGPRHVVFSRIYRRQFATSPFCPPAPPARVIATVSGTSYVDRMVSEGVTYQYELGPVVPSGGEDDRGFLTVTVPGTAPGGPCPFVSDVTPMTTPTPPPPPPTDVPSAPTALVMTPGDQQVRLSWNQADQAHFGYRIYRGREACGPFTWIGSTDTRGRSFTDTGLTNGTANHYFVTAWNSLGEGSESNGVSAAGAPRPPIDGPVLQEVRARTDGIVVRWQPVYGATAHVVKRRTVPAGTFVTIATSFADSYVDAAVVPGTTYAYVVAGTNAFGEGPVSPFPLQATAGPGLVEVTPPASGVTASTHDGNLPGRVVDNDLATRWSGNGDGAWLNLDLGAVHQVAFVKVAVYRGNERRNNFELWLSTDGTTWNKYPRVSSGTTNEEESYDVPDQLARHVRYVGHGATFNNGMPPTSWNSVTEVSVFAASTFPTPTPTPTYTPACTTPPPVPTPPLPPPNVTATAGDGRITVSWDVAFARYRVLRSLSSGGPYTLVADVTVSGPRASYVDEGLTNGTRYFYVVYVFEQRTGGGPPPCPQWTWTNRSPNSAEVSAVPTAAATCTRIVLPPPIIIQASIDDGNVPANAVDGNLATRWTGPGDGAWLRIDLGTVRSVCGVKIAFYRGNERVYRFEIQTSSEGTVWTTALRGQSSGTTNGLETFDIEPDVHARWIRYLGHGNTVNMNNNVTEFEVYGGTGRP